MNKKIKYNGGLVDIDVYTDYTTVWWHNKSDGYNPKTVGRVQNSEPRYTEKLADLINTGKFEIDNLRKSEALAKKRLEDASMLAKQVIEGENIVEKSGKPRSYNVDLPVYVPVKRRRGFFSALRDTRKKK